MPAPSAPIFGQKQTGNTVNAGTSNLVESVMGRRPALRFAIIQEHTRDVVDLDV